MQHGFIKVAAITPQIRVADPYYNAEKICEKIAEAEEHGATCKNKTNAPAGRRTPPMVAEPAAAAAGGFCAAVRRGSCRTETVHGLYE